MFFVINVVTSILHYSILYMYSVLTPLHKVKMLSGFHQQLAYCVSQFIEKDASLSVPVINQYAVLTRITLSMENGSFRLHSIFIRIIKYWPSQNSQKEVLFLGELEELLELTPPEHFQHFMVYYYICKMTYSVASPIASLFNHFLLYYVILINVIYLFPQFQVPLFKQVALSLRSYHFQVLFFFKLCL